MTTEDYLNLITSAFRQKPKFTAMITADVSLAVRVQDLLNSMMPIFDVDAAVGDQLDTIGLWVGASRNITTPISGVYFEWDGADFTTGWDFGTWQPSYQPGEVTILPDDVYRTLIKATIAANRWDGTTNGAYAIWDSVFTTVTILIQDLQNMSYNLGIVGGIIDSLTLALIVNGYIKLRPEGVRINEYFVSINDQPIFGWDMETDLVQGWEEGTWTREFFPS